MCDIKIIGGAKPYRMRHDDLRTQRVRVELDMTVEDYIKLQRKVEGGTLLLEDKEEGRRKLQVILQEMREPVPPLQVVPLRILSRPMPQLKRFDKF
jgi:hypothetical protein